MQKASGVFLWVKLVVQEVLFASQDGASMIEIFENVSRIPADLDDYFRRFMASIENRHKREASIFFQIALHEEDEFTTLHQLTLFDISYLEGEGRDCVRHPGSTGYENFRTSPHRLQQIMDSAYRRVNSRCRGLLECFESSAPSHEILLATVTGAEPAWGIVLSDFDEQLLKSYGCVVDFLHRSFRDFLLQEDVYRELISHTGGMFDVRLFLCKSRVAQLLCLEVSSNSFHAAVATGLASYVMSAIGTPSLKTSPEANLIAERLRDVVEQIQSQQSGFEESVWFLSIATEDWVMEKSSFLTVAIEFDLVSYLRKHLTEDAIRNKPGRPILDHILMRRLHFLNWDRATVNSDLVGAALRLGASPNQKWLGMSIFARYLLSLSHVVAANTSDITSARGPPEMVPQLLLETEESQMASLRAISLLLEYNAESVLPAAWFRDGLTQEDEFPVTLIMGTEMIAVAEILRKLFQQITFTDVKVSRT